MKKLALGLILLITVFATAQTKYTATCIKQPHDGDTTSLLISIGMDVYIEKDCRLMGLDAPEVSTKNLLEKSAGNKVQQILSKFIFQKQFTIYVFEDTNEKFGRPLIQIEVDDVCINDYLVDNSLAKSYLGDKKTPWTDDQLKKIIDFKF
jgi:endonuclease YncB( thermonuclease family)